jgi:hypothetical protein
MTVAELIEKLKKAPQDAVDTQQSEENCSDYLEVDWMQSLNGFVDAFDSYSLKENSNTVKEAIFISFGVYR